MSRVKQYLDIDVVTAARDRIRHIYDIFDEVVVCFSGGKDSLATLRLVHEIAQERGIEKVKVLFRDQELIPDDVISFVDEYRRQPWVEMFWFCVPLLSSKYILGKSVRYVQWDPARGAEGRWLRPMPEWAIKLPPGDTRAFGHDDFDQYAAQFFRGKIAFVTGVRAQESLMRFRSVVNKLHENYLCASGAPTVMMAKPLYDWTENDIFKFFHDQGIRYCGCYDGQHLAQKPLRVASPFQCEAAKVLKYEARIHPEFYDGLMRLFPEMEIQSRYYDELDTAGLVKRYGQSLDGVAAYIVDTIQDEHEQKKAFASLAECKHLHFVNPKAYPVENVFHHIRRGGFRKTMMPIPVAQQEQMERRRQRQQQEATK